MSVYSCPVCKHDDWCWAHHGTGIPCCRRVGDPHQLTYDRNGVPYYYHGEREPVRVTRPPSMPLAPAELRDQVYRSIWYLLSQGELLTETHRAQLEQRGLPETLITGAGLASWPANRRGIIDYLARDFRDHQALLGVPGVYSERGSKLLKLGGLPGLAIPVQDLQGRWVAIRLRPDDASRGKYQWLTSAGPGRGDGPGPPHVPYLACRPHAFRAGNVRAPQVLITEGEPAQGAAPRRRPPRPTGHLAARRRVLEGRRAHPGGGGGRARPASLGPRLAQQPAGGHRPARLLRATEIERA